MDDFNEKMREFMRENGSKGGKAGRGDSKRRGDSEFYRKLAKLRKRKKSRK